MYSIIALFEKRISLGDRKIMLFGKGTNDQDDLNHISALRIDAFKKCSYPKKKCLKGLKFESFF